VRVTASLHHHAHCVTVSLRPCFTMSLCHCAPVPLGRLQRDIRLSYFLVRIVELLLVELYVTHLAGCIFYFLALTYPPDQEGLTWIGSLALGPNSYENFRELPLGVVYVTSLYWSVVTMGTIGTPPVYETDSQPSIQIHTAC